MNTIQTIQLSKRYGQKLALDNLNLEIAKGELFGLLGVNGAGKSTAIKILSCVSRPSQGDARVLGYSVTLQPFEVKRRINISPQETAIAPNLSVRENLEFIARIYGCGRQTAHDKTDTVLASSGLEAIEYEKARVLSGGWQRRLSIAMALISDPQVLFLDEPTLGLDVLARRELWMLIQKLKGEVTMILTTHYLEEAEALSDRIGILANGKLKAIGTVAEIKQRTHSPNLEEAFISLAGEREGQA
ncbi:ABC transporter ATP-binding protein [Pelolinea submarina]|uniref:ABC-2 type transport system ATP-binding protein n=1 Tax=Pelolinea submarina TaxID=913107 RepID=A0A347ZVM6_9CHLR|nr:ABC transporter ATP-binding protein [Pelolinea submarina]REG07052.1 ABC-2 type transport system ATP-binding protein [Pelolinea submarina]BBB49357.1 ABC-2 type transport system ATP-binding protein [Pelolinea submarina]